MTDEPCKADWQKAVAETNRLQRELDITNADHIALWIGANTIPDEPMNQCASWLACRIVEAHEAEIDRRVAEEKAKLLERLQGLSSWLGAGSSEDVEDLENRIRWGVELQASATIQRCADVVEKLSKTPSTKWGEVKAEILALKEQQP